MELSNVHSCKLVKSGIAIKAPTSSKILGSWVEAIPRVRIPAATAERIPEGESSSAIADLP